MQEQNPDTPTLRHSTQCLFCTASKDVLRINATRKHQHYHKEMFILRVNLRRITDFLQKTSKTHTHGMVFKSERPKLKINKYEWAKTTTKHITIQKHFKSALLEVLNSGHLLIEQ